MLTPYRVGFLTVSDRAAAGVYEDLGGPRMQSWMARACLNPITPYALLVPDMAADIKDALTSLADTERCPLILTTGGTGPAKRDITPEITASLCDKLLPGFGEKMRAASLQFVPTAILSTQTAGIRGTSLIINLPGKPKAIDECLDAIFDAVPYCLHLLGHARLETNPEACRAFWPKDTSQANRTNSR